MTLCTPLPGILTFGTYSGCAYTNPSTVCEKSLPNCPPLTSAGVRVVSFRFCPVRRLSLCWVVTAPCAVAAIVSGNLALALSDCESFTCTSKLHVPAAPGVPAIAPLELRVTPAGKLPERRLHVYGG